MISKYINTIIIIILYLDTLSLLVEVSAGRDAVVNYCQVGKDRLPEMRWKIVSLGWVLWLTSVISAVWEAKVAPPLRLGV